MQPFRRLWFRRADIALAALLTSLVALLALSYREFDRLVAANRASLHTYAVLKQANALEEALATMEAGYRGYALTGGHRHLRSWNDARREWQLHLGELRSLARDDAARLAQLEHAERQWGAWTELQIASGVVDTAAVPNRLPAAAAAAAADPAGAARRSAVVDEVRMALRAIESAESEQLLRRVARTQVLERQARLLLGSLGAATLLLVVLNAAIAYGRTHALRAANRLLQGEIAAREAAQAHAERAARDHRRVLDAAVEGIVGVDPEGRVTFVNPAAERILGCTDPAVAGRPLEWLLGIPADRPEAASLRTALAAGAGAHAGAGTFRRAGGASFPAEYSVAPLADGRREGAVITFRDVTARREVERMKDEFVSVVSHELRTPLTSIRGSLGLLAAGKLGEVPERGRRMLEIAVQNTDRLVRLINDILDIERIESGKVPLQVQRLEAATLLEDALDVVRAVAERAEVEVRVVAREGAVEGDRDRLVQVLTNLLSNAVKFSEAGAVVEVSAEREGAEVVFRVRDHGRGIPPEKLEAVFERFHQVDSSDAREKGGTGLGLAIARSIVQQHGGTITARSTPGQGSTFTVRLPAAAPVAEAAGAEEPASAGPAILVCDDDPDVRETVAEVLRSWGYRPLLAGNGGEAVEIARREHPAAILMDLLMPGMSGSDALAALREDPETRGIPVVVLSVLPRGTGGSGGDPVAGWVEKPFEEGRLLQALEGAVGRRWQSARVLVVEDDADLARVLVETFARHGVEAVHASTGRQAVELARDARPDMVVLDLTLPDGDGYWVIDALRRDDDVRTAPLVVYSAAEVDEADRRRLRLGETAFMNKGRVAPEALERHVISILNRLAPAPGASPGKDDDG